jgi:hypothetical protein
MSSDVPSLHGRAQSGGTHTCIVPWLSLRRGHRLRSASFNALGLSVPRTCASSAYDIHRPAMSSVCIVHDLRQTSRAMPGGTPCNTPFASVNGMARSPAPEARPTAATHRRSIDFNPRSRARLPPIDWKACPICSSPARSQVVGRCWSRRSRCDGLARLRRPPGAGRERCVGARTTT